MIGAADRDSDFVAPSFFHVFISAAVGRRVEPPILDLGTRDGGKREYLARVSPYEEFVFIVSGDWTAIVHRSRDGTIGMWVVEEPPAVLILFRHLMADQLVHFDREIVPRVSLVWLCEPGPNADALPDEQVLRKERLILCEDGAVILVLSEAKGRPRDASGQVVEYSVAALPVLDWWNFQCRTWEAHLSVTRPPVRQRIPYFAGTAGLVLHLE